MDFEAVLRTFGEYFEREGIRFAVIGGLAMQAWGASRFTRDIDIVVSRADRDRVIAFAEGLGYETLHVSQGYSNHLHGDASRGRVDFMYVDERTAERLLTAVVRKTVAGETVLPVASAEHLAMMKALAMKNSPHRVLFESNDVQQLLSVPGIDRDAVREYFAKQGLLELFDAIERSR